MHDNIVMKNVFVVSEPFTSSGYYKELLLQIDIRLLGGQMRKISYN